MIDARTLIWDGLVAASMIVNGILDIRSRKVNSMIFLAVSLAGLFMSQHPIICAICSVSCIFLKDGYLKHIGAGDVDAFLMCLALFWIDSIIIYFAIAALCAILWAVITKKKDRIPFVACQAVGCLAVYAWVLIKQLI